jgi:hypothetical protein
MKNAATLAGVIAFSCTGVYFTIERSGMGCLGSLLGLVAVYDLRFRALGVRPPAKDEE